MTQLLANNFAKNYFDDNFDNIIFNNKDYKQEITNLFSDSFIAEYIYNEINILMLKSVNSMLADNCFE